MMSEPARRRLVELLDTALAYFGDGFRSARPAPAPVGEDRRDEPTSGPADSLENVARQVAVCDRCALATTRRMAVAGEGVAKPAVLVVGEGPGADEDATGRPFVGAAGKYLDKWLAAVGLDRTTNCFIANVVKCRPPGNRDPRPEEIAQCRAYLERQVDLLTPRAILAVGRFAAQALTGATQGINTLRGAVREYRGIPLVATFHPSAVLRDPTLRAPVWEDLKRLKTLLDHA